MLCFFFKQKTAYEMRISDWSSDVCSSDLGVAGDENAVALAQRFLAEAHFAGEDEIEAVGIMAVQGQRIVALVPRIGQGKARRVEQYLRKAAVAHPRIDAVLQALFDDRGQTFVAQHIEIGRAHV